MRNFFSKNSDVLINVLIITVLFILVYAFFPAERKFRYEFRRGKPWQHENLIAPFDFPIYKLPEELKKERDSIESQIKLYFKYDQNVGIEQLNNFSDYYHQKIREFLKQDSLKRAKDFKYKYNTPKINVKKYDELFEYVKSNLDFIYKVGVFDPTEIIDVVSKYPNYYLLIFKNNLVKTYDYDQIFTLKRAYQYLMNKLSEYEISHPEDKEIVEFFKNMDLSNFIKSNLIFNLDKTYELHRKELEEISATRGKVQAGELIISQGEVVTLDKYRILVSLKRAYEQNLTSATIFIHIGNFLILSLVFTVLILFIYNYKPEILRNYKYVLLIFSMVSIFILISIALVKYSSVNVYIIPYALMAIILKIFFDERLAMFSYLIAILIIGFLVPNSFEFIVMEFIAGFAAIFSLTQLSRRGQLYISVVAVFLAMSFMYLGLALLQEADFMRIRWNYFLYFAINSLLLLLAYPLIYVFERLFGLISDITLLELMNTNHPLLYKLSTTAPGTFQHSLQVANLAEAVAKQIGANALLTRVGALYHDIGKLYAPGFFIENQFSKHNPHDDMEFDKSAQMIINHVTKGIELANKYKLPEQIKDFIRTHHGTTTVQYFYKNFIKKYPDKKDEIEKFKYPGPKPFSKETVILMMADSIEAASRSLKEYSKETISNLVNKIIDYQMSEGQYTDADITFKEITKLKELFVNLLLSIYHTRIPYPEK